MNRLSQSNRPTNHRRAGCAETATAHCQHCQMSRLTQSRRTPGVGVG